MCLLALFFPLPSWAWNSAGHRLIALIAWDHLEPRARSEAARLLHKHPDFERWSKRVTEADVDRGAFIEASTWADEIRKDRRFYNAESDAPTPTLSGFPDMDQHRNWHFVNLKLDGSPFDSPISGLLGKQLVVLTNTLSSSKASSIDRSYALPWLIHLVGDAHQPLHTSIQSKVGGGKETTISNPFNPRKTKSTLHAFWDDLPGPPWLRGERLEATARALIAAYPPPARSNSSDKWLVESWHIAREQGYPTWQDEGKTISSQFFETSRAIADRRITEAGYRLADLLNRRLTD